MNKIKVIDLLNIISKGEEIPKKIKYKGYEFEYNQGEEDYFNRKMGYGMLDDLSLFSELNKEVEIIEEEKEIKKPIGYENFEGIDDYIEHLKSKIDELIDAVNELRKEK